MINKKLFEILSCPECGETGFESEASNRLVCSVCSKSYDVIDGIPIMLVTKNENQSEASDIHKQMGTSFNYVDHYQKDATEFDYFQTRNGATGHYETRLREYIVSTVPKIPETILDVGCGSAWVAQTFCPKGYHVISMDISLKNTSEALKRNPAKTHMAVVADAYFQPFADNSIDVIIASEIIEHIEDPKKFMESLLRVLKPGGEIIVTTPYKEKLTYSLCIHCNKPTPRSAHLHSFDEIKLESLVQSDDLESFTFSTFGNKVLIHLRTHVVFKYVNFTSWNLIDKLSNWVYNAPSVILVKWRKNLKS